MKSRKSKDRYYQAEGGFDENVVNMSGIHGEYTIEREKLAEICNLDNHHKYGSSDYPDMIRSSRMIMEEYGGPAGIMKALFTDPKTGILGSPEDIKDRQRIYGVNAFPPPKIKTIYELIMENFEDFINQVLLGAALVSLAIGLYKEGFPTGLIEGTSIAIALVIIVSVTSVNNYLSEKRLAELVALSEQQEVAVFRNSDKAQTIDSTELVVGDLVKFSMGEKVPADMMMIDGQDVMCNQSELNGEPDSLPKTPIDQSNYQDGSECTMLAKSLVEGGVGKAIVMAVGRSTVSGIITDSTLNEPEQTLLMKKLETMAGKIGNIGFAVATGTFIASLLRIIVEYAGFLPCGCQNMFSCKDPLPGTCESYNFGDLNNAVYPTLLESIIIAITVVVVAIPEGLPLAVTISLSFSSAKMQKLNNLVRKIASAETMGGATHICSDKTGTLTKNQMTVMATMAAQQIVIGDKTAEGKDIIERAQNTYQSVNQGDQTIWDILFESIMWNSSAWLEKNDFKDPNITTEWVTKGNVTEQGIIKFFINAVTANSCVHKKSELTDEKIAAVVPFTSKRKMGSIVVRQEDKAGTDQEIRTYCKGAPDMLLKKCKFCIALDGSVQPIDSQTAVPVSLLGPNEEEGTMDSYKGVFERTINKFAKQAYRTILVTYNDMSLNDFEYVKQQNNGFAKEDDREALEQNLIAVGIFGLQDPLREGIIESIEQCKTAGIRVIMCTGDNLETAKAISLNAGIVTQNEVDNNKYACMTGEDFRNQVQGLRKFEYNGKEVESVGDMQKFKEIKAQLRVLARSSPQDKYILVTGVQEDDGVVAVTGDGTNDAPALTKSDVGFSMGITGTDVAKGASDIILLDDNFSSIIVALKYGRNVYDNVRKFLQFQLTVNYVAMFIVFLGAVVTKKSPLNAVQMLWVNLIMDTFAALALATEPPPADILTRQPYKKHAPIITPNMSRNVQGHALYQIIVLLVLLFAGPNMLIEHEFESQCAMYDAEGICVSSELNPFYTTSEYYDPAIWSNFVKESSDQNVINSGELAGNYQFDKQLLFQWQCGMFTQDHPEYESKIEKMDLCHVPYDEFQNKQYEGSQADVKQAFVTSKWREVLPSTKFLTLEDGTQITSEGKMTEQTKLFSFVFNAFVFMQIFNQLNARLLENGELNVFKGIFKNPMFVAIVFVTVVVQLVMVEFGGRMVKCWPLNSHQNFICIMIGLGELPWGLIIKFIPHKAFVFNLSLEDPDQGEGPPKKYLSTTLKSKGKKNKVDEE